MKKLLFTFFILMAPTLASAATIGKVNANNIGLVGYWTFDGANMSPRVMDKSGRNYNAALRNTFTSTTTVPGKIGQALNFNGINNDVLITPSNPANGGDLTTLVTISAWIRPNDVTAEHSIYETDGSWWVEQNGSTLEWRSAFGGLSANLGSGSVVTKNVWQHVVFTGSPTSLRIYLNGVEVARSSAAILLTAPADTTHRIGSTNSRWFSGDIDDVRVYNRELSATEVAALYNSGSAGVARSLTTATSSVALSNGLVGYWTLDGSKTNWATGKTLDSTGNSNVGQLVGMATSTAPGFGKVGQAFTFDGVDDQVVIADNGTLDFTTGMTASAWIRTTQTSFPGTFAYILKKNTFTGSGPFSLYTAINQINFFIRAQDGGNPGVAAVFTADGAWHHVVGTYDGQAVRLYVDGVIKGQANYVNTIVVDASAVAIGGYTASGRFFQGHIDDARVYNRALSPTEIAELYKLGDNKIAQSPTLASSTSISDGLVGYWTFDGSKTNWTTGKTLDSVGSRTGTLVGMATGTAPALGKVGQSFDFAAGVSASVVTLPSDPFGTSPATICGWVYTYRYPGGTYQLYESTTAMFHLNVNGGMQFSSDHANLATSASGAVVRNQWTQVCATRDASGIANIYISGVLSGTANQNSGTPASGIVPRFGNVSNQNTGYQGRIDDIRIYNRVLTPTEIQQLYNMNK